MSKKTHVRRFFPSKYGGKEIFRRGKKNFPSKIKKKKCPKKPMSEDFSRRNMGGKKFSGEEKKIFPQKFKKKKCPKKPMSEDFSRRNMEGKTISGGKKIFPQKLKKKKCPKKPMSEDFSRRNTGGKNVQEWKKKFSLKNLKKKNVQKNPCQRIFPVEIWGERNFQEEKKNFLRKCPKKPSSEDFSRRNMGGKNFRRKKKFSLKFLKKNVQKNPCVTWALLVHPVLAVLAYFSVDGDSAKSPRAWQSRYAEPRSDSERDNVTAAGPGPEISDACGERQLPTGQFPPFASFDRGTAQNRD